MNKQILLYQVRLLIVSKLINTTKHYTNYLTKPTRNTSIVTPTNTEEIKDIIKTLYIRKSIVPNSIHTRLLKKVYKKISITIKKLINLSFETGIFPVNLKLARIIPIFKKRRLTTMQQLQTYFIDIKY